jgi:chemotaxis signal transduction protein
MRFLTFEIGGHRLAVPAENVVSVGRPYAKEKVHSTDVRRLLGAGSGDEAGPQVITCRVRKKLVEFPVDRVLNLEECRDQQIKPWPAALSGHSLFKGLVDLKGSLFLILDLEPVSAEAGRIRR